MPNKDLEVAHPLMQIIVEKIENGYLLSLRDRSYQDKDYAFFNLDEALNKVKEVYGELQ